MTNFKKILILTSVTLLLIASAGLPYAKAEGPGSPENGNAAVLDDAPIFQNEKVCVRCFKTGLDEQSSAFRTLQFSVENLTDVEYTITTAKYSDPTGNRVPDKGRADIDGVAYDSFVSNWRWVAAHETRTVGIVLSNQEGEAVSAPTEGTIRLTLFFTSGIDSFSTEELSIDLSTFSESGGQETDESAAQNAAVVYDNGIVRISMLGLEPYEDAQGFRMNGIRFRVENRTDAEYLFSASPISISSGVNGEKFTVPTGENIATFNNTGCRVSLFGDDFVDGKETIEFVLRLEDRAVDALSYLSVPADASAESLGMTFYFIDSNTKREFNTGVLEIDLSGLAPAAGVTPTDLANSVDTLTFENETVRVYYAGVARDALGTDAMRFHIENLTNRAYLCDIAPISEDAWYTKWEIPGKSTVTLDSAAADLAGANLSAASADPALMAAVTFYFSDAMGHMFDTGEMPVSLQIDPALSETSLDAQNPESTSAAESILFEKEKIRIDFLGIGAIEEGAAEQAVYLSMKVLSKDNLYYVSTAPILPGDEFGGLGLGDITVEGATCKCLLLGTFPQSYGESILILALMGDQNQAFSFPSGADAGTAVFTLYFADTAGNTFDSGEITLDLSNAPSYKQAN